MGQKRKRVTPQERKATLQSTNSENNEKPEFLTFRINQLW